MLPCRLTNEQLAHELLLDPEFQLNELGGCNIENPIYHTGVLFSWLCHTHIHKESTGKIARLLCFQRVQIAFWFVWFEDFGLKCKVQSVLNKA